MRYLAEELYERTKSMIAEITLEVMKDNNIDSKDNVALESILEDYYTLRNKKVKLEYILKDAKIFIDHIQDNNNELLHDIKITSDSRVAIVALFRSTMAYIFSKKWNLSQERIASLLCRERSTISYMVSTTENNIWQYNNKKEDCLEKKVISYLFVQANMKDPFNEK